MNKFFGIGLIIVLLIGVISGALLVQRQQLLKSRAEFAACTMNANPSSGSSPLNTFISVGVNTSGMPDSKRSQWDLDGDGTYEKEDSSLSQEKSYTSSSANPITFNPKFRVVDGPGSSTVLSACSASVTVIPSSNNNPPPPPPPPPPTSNTGSCPDISQWRNYDLNVFKTNCTQSQRDLLPNEALLKFSKGDLMTYFSLSPRLLQLGTGDLATFSNSDLIRIGQASGNLGTFLARFSNERLLEFGLDILRQLPPATIASFSQDIQNQINNAAGGGAGGGVSGGLPRGSECVSFQVTDSTGKDVTTTGPVYEGERYVFKLTFKNKTTTGEPQSWTKATHRLQALGDTVSIWGTQAAYPLTKELVTKDNIEVFNIDVTAGVLTAGKNREERPFHYSMADAAGTFGAACERNITVLKKPAGLVTTECYVLSEDATEVNNVTSCDDAKARPYSAHPTNLTYPFKTPLLAATPRTLYVKFFDSNGRSTATPHTKTIIYTPPPTPPSISGVNCAYDSSGLATIYTLRGTSLGTQTANTKVKVGNADAEVTSWTATAITAKADQRLEGSNNVQVSLDDGKKLDGTCSVGLTTATLSVKNKCATADSTNTDDIDVSIYDSGPQPFLKQKARPDKDGTLQGFTPKLEKNKTYTALFKAAGFLTKKVVFNTSSGTSVVDPVTLAPGDIAPKPTSDDVINSVDVSELKTQWNLVKDVTRTGDLNKDSRVNSLDYSCMKSSFNLRGDIFVTGSAGVGSTVRLGVGSSTP